MCRCRGSRRCLLGIATWLAACGGGPGPGDDDAGPGAGIDAAPDAAAVAVCPEREGLDPPQLDAISIAGDPSVLGPADPSIVWPAGRATGAIAYTESSFVGSVLALSTSIATAPAADPAAWTRVAAANTAVEIDVTLSDPAVCGADPLPCERPGVLAHEVPALIEDASDPEPARRWKMLVQSYAVLAGPSYRHDLGYVEIQTAPAPEGPWSEGTRLFGWPSASPMSTDGVAIQLPCALAGEPGLLATSRGLAAALVCAGPAGFSIQLYESTDHGATWELAGTMLTGAELFDLCGDELAAAVTGADLYQVDGRTFLSVTPGLPMVDDPGDAPYGGCMVFEVDDLATAQLRRDADGVAMPARWFGATAAAGQSAVRYSGPCTWAPGAAALGYVLSIRVRDDSNPKILRIYASGVVAP